VQGPGIVPLVGAHRHGQGQVLGGQPKLTGAARGEPEAEMGVVVGRTDRDECGEGGHGFRVSPCVVLRAAQSLEDAARVGFHVGGAGQERGGSGGMSVSQELDTALIPLVDAPLGRARLGHAHPLRPRIDAPGRIGYHRHRRPALPADRGGDAARLAPTITDVPLPSGSASPPATAGLDVRPFRALTYRRQDPEHLARVSSPAYDLVTPAGRDRLAAADPHNIVRLILPHVVPDPGASGGTVHSAQQAAGTLIRWVTDGILVRDEHPALWLYEMSPADGQPETVGWLGAVALPAVGSRAVLPHEDTYAPAVEGRRALLAATATDLEPIVLAHDPEPETVDLTATARTADPTLEITDTDGVRHRLWRVTDRSVLDRLNAALHRTEAVIADGHHRFAAAQAHARAATRVPGSEAVLALVTPMGPGGLRVAAIHRVLPDLGLDIAVAQARKGFQLRDLPGTGNGSDAVVDSIRRWLATAAEAGFLLTDGHRIVQLTNPAENVLAAIPAEAPAAWQGLDVVLAHHGLLARLLHRADDPSSVVVAHSVEEAVGTAAARSGVALLLRAPSPAAVAAVARSGARMPRKSTLFVPKPRTGLVLRPLAD
jgi:uncharacterized protein (DUF1015 family)